ncbi:hypothetical protein PFISCL1PPCAC_12136, partial [Pristionchus fissidentatus]
LDYLRTELAALNCTLSIRTLNSLDSVVLESFNTLGSECDCLSHPLGDVPCLRYCTAEEPGQAHTSCPLFGSKHNFISVDNTIQSWIDDGLNRNKIV